MPKPKRNALESGETEDANPARASPELTPALLKEMLTTTIGEEISSLRTELLAEICSSTATLQTTIAAHGTKIQEIESAVNLMDTRLDEAELRFKSVQADNEALRKKVDDLENRSRRNNLRVIGIPENAELPRSTDFMIAFFSELFGDKLSQTPEIERAHRSLGPKPRPGAPPRRCSCAFFAFK